MRVFLFLLFFLVLFFFPFLLSFRINLVDWVGQVDGIIIVPASRPLYSERLEFERLPPYSPELNPVERFFKELRATLRNRVFDIYEQVEAAVIKAVKPYLKDTEKVRRLTWYGWLLNAPT